jgi:hypothetical protein
VFCYYAVSTAKGVLTCCHCVLLLCCQYCRGCIDLLSLCFVIMLSVLQRVYWPAVNVFCYYAVSTTEAKMGRVIDYLEGIWKKKIVAQQTYQGRCLRVWRKPRENLRYAWVLPEFRNLQFPNSILQIVTEATCQVFFRLRIKRKGFPYQARCGPKGSRRFRLPDFMKFGTWRWWGSHPHAPAAFTPRKCSWYSFSLGAESTPGSCYGRKEICHWKFQWHHRKSIPGPSD